MPSEYKTLRESLSFSSGRNVIAATEVLKVTTNGAGNPYEAMAFVKSQFPINTTPHHDPDWYNSDEVTLLVSGHRYIRRVNSRSYRIAVLYRLDARHFGSWVRLRRWQTGGEVDPTFSIKTINRTGTRSDGSHAGEPVFGHGVLRFRRFRLWRREYHIVQLSDQDAISAAIEQHHGKMFFFGADNTVESGFYLLSGVGTNATNNGTLQLVWKFEAGSSVPGYDSSGDVGAPIPPLGRLDEYTVLNQTDPMNPVYGVWKARDIYGDPLNPRDFLPGNW